MDFRVRPGVAGDLAAVIALERAIPEAPHWVEAEYGAIIGAQPGNVQRFLLVAEEVSEKGLIGFVVGKVIVAAEVAELESVAVDAQARRHGVGKALCQAIVEWSRRKMANELLLEVRASSLGAISLYEGLGFEAEGRRSGYYTAPDEDAVVMKMKLEKDE